MDITKQDTNWVSKKICNICDKKLKKNEKHWIKVPCIWRKPLDQKDCYFCMTKIGRINNKKKLNSSYAEVSSASKPIYFSTQDEESIDVMDISYPDIEDVLDSSSKDNSSMVDNSREEKESEDGSEERSEIESSDDEYTTYDIPRNKNPNQEELNNLVRNLGLPTDGSEYLASLLKS